MTWSEDERGHGIGDNSEVQPIVILGSIRIDTTYFCSALQMIRRHGRGGDSVNFLLAESSSPRSATPDRGSLRRLIATDHRLQGWSE